jgi:hypothetical protein
MVYLLLVCFAAGWQIENRKLEWNVGSKIGSLDNAQHVPGGGDKKVTMETNVLWSFTKRQFSFVSFFFVALALVLSASNSS